MIKRPKVPAILILLLALSLLAACDMGAATPTATVAPAPAPTSTLQAAIPPSAPMGAKGAPAWARDSVLYQIFVRTFTPEGTLNAAKGKLRDLKDLGVNLIYLMPIHPIGKVNRKGTLGSPYSVQDYYKIDPALGAEADLKAFVDEAHSLGMHVSMDLVANHTAWDNVLTTQHPDWYKHGSDGKFVLPNPDWTDVIQLDHSQPGLLQYMIDMTTNYIQADGVDGFRCDYSASVPIPFWTALRQAIKKVKPDAFLLSENDDRPLAAVFDATYDQQTYKALLDAFLQHKPKLLLNVPLTEDKQLGPNHLETRFFENHDQRRAAYVFQMAPPEALQAASTYLLTTDDIPFIESGEEVGMTQTLSLFEPDKINWAAGNPALREVFKKDLALRNANPALRHGKIADAASSVKSVTAFARYSDEQQVLVLISFDTEKQHVNIEPGIAKRQGKDLQDGSAVDLSGGVDMPPWSWRMIELK